MYIIAGLGNPGIGYKYTRHNVGFVALDFLSSEFGIPIKKIKWRAVVGDGEIAGEKVLLVKPQTYMNLSGESIRDIVDYYNLTPEQLIVIYDDAALDIGRIRIRAKGTDGGHNGIKSIIYQLQADNFLRVKLGIGNNLNIKDHVLSKFTDEEDKIISPQIKKLGCVVSSIIKDGVEAAQNLFN